MKLKMKSDLKLFAEIRLIYAKNTVSFRLILMQNNCSKSPKSNRLTFNLASNNFINSSEIKDEIGFQIICWKMAENAPISENF